MNFLKKLFVKNPADLLARGDRLMDDRRYYDARCLFEEARQLLSGDAGRDNLHEQLSDCDNRIATANHALAELNIAEAEAALARSLPGKAFEHLELAKTLTSDSRLREKAEKLATRCCETEEQLVKPAPASGCASCSTHAAEVTVTNESNAVSMPVMEYYDLLIQQLPQEMCERYNNLGEKFALMYVAASENRYYDALGLLEKWFDGSSRDIYFYEKGMILFRLGLVGKAEESLRAAIAANGVNSLAHLGLALMLIEGRRLPEAGSQLDAMVSAGILVDQSRLLRADVHLLSGDMNQAIELFSALLTTPVAIAAAGKLHDVLTHTGRVDEAAYIAKRYLKGCCH